MKIIDKFNPDNAKSKGYEEHDEGKIPFVTNGFYDNGVIGFVTPLPKEKVFYKKGICVSAFCEATVQNAPFLPRGNGGSGLLVLVPKEEMTDEELYHYAAQINLHSWRFSYGRMVTEDRIASLDIIPAKKKAITIEISKLLPKSKRKDTIKISKFKEIPLTDLCNVDRNYAPYMNQVDTSIQRTPYVTTTETDNGVSMLCNEEPNSKKGTVTVSLDGRCGETFYQFIDFISGEKTAILSLKDEVNPYVLFYIATIIRIKRWRYDYGRKLSKGRLEKFTITMPIAENGQIDKTIIKKLVQNTYGSEIFEKHMVS